MDSMKHFDSTRVMNDTRTAKVLVVDTGAILKGARLEVYAEVFYTIPEVVGEVRDRQAREQLQQLPYELQVRQPTEAAMKESKHAVLTGGGGDGHCSMSRY
jgi:RNA-binding protein NOB1